MPMLRVGAFVTQAQVRGSVCVCLALKEGMATHSGILAWSIPRTEEPGRLQSIGSESDTTEAT